MLSPAWASARSKNKKPDLAKAMEQAFAAGDPPLGLSADMHAAALAWVPPGFAAFDTGQVEDEPEGAAAGEPAAEASGPDPEPVAGPAADAESAETPADPPRTNSVVESIEAPAESPNAGPPNAPPPTATVMPATVMPRRLLRKPIPPLAITGAMPEWTVPSPEPPNRPSRRISPPTSRTGERHDAGDGSTFPSSCAAYRGIPPSTDRTPRSVMRPAGPPSGGAFPFPHPSGRSA